MAKEVLRFELFPNRMVAVEEERFTSSFEPPFGAFLFCPNALESGQALPNSVPCPELPKGA